MSAVSPLGQKCQALNLIDPPMGTSRMTRFFLHRLGAIVTLLLLSFSFESLPTLAQSQRVWLPLAKTMAMLASRSEQSGELDEALKLYGSVISSAEGALRNTPASDLGAATEGNIVLAAGHIDAARVLQRKAVIALLRQADGRAKLVELLGRIDITQHIKAAEVALEKAGPLDQQLGEEITRKNQGKPIQQRILCCSYAGLINTALADVQLLKGETAQARNYYTAALAKEPSSERAKAALVHLDDVARIGAGPPSASQQKIQAWYFKVLGADVTRKVGAAFAKEIAGRWGPLAGSVSGVMADALIGYAQSRVKSE